MFVLGESNNLPELYLLKTKYQHKEGQCPIIGEENKIIENEDQELIVVVGNLGEKSLLSRKPVFLYMLESETKC
jgi:hypothetical protein